MSLTGDSGDTQTDLGSGVHSGGGDGGGGLADGAGQLLTNWFGHHGSTLRPGEERTTTLPAH